MERVIILCFVFIIATSHAISDRELNAVAEIVVESLKGGTVHTEEQVLPKKRTKEYQHRFQDIGISIHDDLRKEKKDFWDIPAGWEFYRIEVPSDLRYERTEDYEFGGFIYKIFHGDRLLIRMKDYWDYGRLRDAQINIYYKDYNDYLCNTYRTFRYECFFRTRSDNEKALYYIDD